MKKRFYPKQFKDSDEEIAAVLREAEDIQNKIVCMLIGKGSNAAAIALMNSSAKVVIDISIQGGMPWHEVRDLMVENLNTICRARAKEFALRPRASAANH